MVVTDTNALREAVPALQLRNLVLSAFSRDMKLPDPFTPNLRIELLPEISQAPVFLPPAETLLPPQLKCGPCLSAAPVSHAVLLAASGIVFRRGASSGMHCWQVCIGACMTRALLEHPGLMCRADVDTYLSTRGPPTFLMGLKQRLTLPENEALDAGSAYNIPLINALIFYCGIEARSLVPHTSCNTQA